MSASARDAAPPGQSLAVAAEVLYLVNLLLLPGLAFLGLLLLWRQAYRGAPPLARCHLRQTLAASLWAGGLLIGANLAIVLLGGYDQPATWVVAILYFTIFHSSLVLLGVLGLARAMAGQPYRYPLIGRPCDDD
ncbi:MAG: hypothetical protein WHV61_07140 [Burkholderiales bacterium]